MANWTNLSFSFGAILTSQQMTQLDDNFDAFAEKASGAPVLANDYIVNAMVATDAINKDSIAADAVGDSELNVDSITTGSQAVSASSTWTPAKGIYSWVGTASVFRLYLPPNYGTAAGQGGFVTAGGTLGLNNNSGSSETVSYYKFGG